MHAAADPIDGTGTLGVLRAAALKDYIDLPTTLARLLETNFRVSMELVAALLAENAERRRRHSNANQKPSEVHRVCRRAVSVS